MVTQTPTAAPHHLLQHIYAPLHLAVVGKKRFQLPLTTSATYNRILVLKRASLASDEWLGISILAPNVTCSLSERLLENLERTLIGSSDVTGSD